MAYKKRVRAQTGGTPKLKKFRNAAGQEVVGYDEPSAPAGPRGIVDPSAAAAASEFSIDADTLELPLKGFVKDPFSKKNLDVKQFQKLYPGVVLPGDAGYKPKQRYKFRRSETGPPTLFEVETLESLLRALQPGARAAKGGKVPKVMGEFKAGSLHSGSKKGPKVKSRDQAVAIALSEAREAGESVPRRRAAAGGLVGLQQQRIGDIQAPTTGITNIADELQGFQPGGGQDVNALRSFQPLTGPAAATQGQLLTTGLQTDVAPLTQAAQIRAGQEFDTATSGINERLAAQGLISSSAQTAAEARERAKLGERVGATGLEAGVQAAEAAAGRRQGAVGAELSASGQRLGATGQALEGTLAQGQQRLGALGTALSGRTSAAGLNLEASQGRAAGGQSLINSQMPQFGSEMAQPPAGRGVVKRSARPSSGGARWATGQGSGGVMRSFAHGGRVAAAGGGRADLGDFLSSLLYGQKFKRRTGSEGVQEEVVQRRPMRSTAAPVSRGGSSLDDAFKREALMRLRNPSGGGRTPRGIGPEELGSAAASTLDPGNRLARTGGDFSKLGKYLQFLGPEQVGAGTRTAGQGFAALAGAASGNAPSLAALESQNLTNRTFTRGRQRAQGGGVPQPELPQEMGIQELSSYDPRRRFYAAGGMTPGAMSDRDRFSYDEGGGVAPGQDTGEDKIPAMLRSEELVLTPELADAVVQANPLEPNPELIMSLQDLAKQPLEFGEEEGEFMAAQGGSAPPGFRKEDVNLKDVFNSIFGLSDEANAGFERRYGIPAQGFEEEFDVPVPPAGSIPGPRPAPSLPGREDLLRQGAAATLLESLGVPSPAEAGQDFSTEELGPEPGSVSLERVGGGRLGRAGDAGFGRIQPRPEARGSFSAMTSTVPSAQPLTPEQQVAQRLTSATQRRDLIQAALTTDRVGSPEKQARLLSALDNAERQVNGITNEVLAREQNRLMGEQTQLRQTVAEANVNESVAGILRAKAQQQTAEAALAKQLLEASTTDPVVGEILNRLEKLGNIKDPRTAAQYEAVFGKLLESRDIQIRENGWLRRLFGAPEYEVEPAQAEAGAAPVAPGDDVGAMLAASRQPITPEMLSFFNQYGMQ